MIHKTHHSATYTENPGWSAKTKELVRYAVEAYSHVMYPETEFTFADLANAIPEHYEMDARREELVRALLVAEGCQYFVVDGIKYGMEPDITEKIVAGYANQWRVRPPRGFNGKEFVILPFEGGRIVTHNLWLIGETNEPDNARFEGDVPKTTKIHRNSWELKMFGSET